MRTFSKSKLIALRQCQKRFWLEIHHPELKTDTLQTQAGFAIGNDVGEMARKIYDPLGKGSLIDIKKDGFKNALQRSKDLLQGDLPIFEAGFSAAGGLAFSDVMLPDEQDGARAWRMVEIKSSTSIKDSYRDDVAVQAYVAQTAGVALKSVSIAHIDSKWTYPGNGNYQGLLKETDLTTEVFTRSAEVKEWIEEAQIIAAQKEAPAIKTGSQCNTPYACGFYDYCSMHMPKPEYPISWLPRFPSSKIYQLANEGIYDLKDLPDHMLNSKQLLVKEHTLNNKVYFDEIGAAACFELIKLPAYFLDFETISFAIPIWKCTRPYQQITFQFSLHIIDENRQLTHSEFLDLSGENPSESFAKALIDSCGSSGPVFVYSASFEMSRIRELADRLPTLNRQLLAINERVIDLLPIVRDHYYHPTQEGSWSIKKVLSAVAPELRYDDLEGVQNGMMAMSAFQEAIHENTSSERKAEIREQLLKYCKLDTYAMVRLWQVFSGRSEISL